MKQRTMDEMITYFNQQVSKMDIDRQYKMALLGMITAIGYENKKQEQKWIPCSERLPDSRRSVLITVSNGKYYETCEAYYHELRKDWFEVNGDRVCEMSPRWKTIAWCELPEPYKEDKR